MRAQREMEPSRAALCLAEAFPRGKEPPRIGTVGPAEIVAIGQLLIEIGDTPWRCDDRALTEQALASIETGTGLAPMEGRWM